MKRNRFYKTSPHGGVGSNICFHGVKGNGYVTNLDDAHIYTREEAQNEVDKDWMRDYPEQELFLSADHVDELSVWKVDSQYVNLTYPETLDPNNEYVLYRKGVWDGNDLGFAAELSFNYDYSKARVFTKEQIDTMDCDGWVVVPKFHTDEIARRTFQYSNVNRRKMISSAGIVGIRKKRKRQSSGKTRWNCPECGKIVWQHNPHEFMSCSDIECSAYDGYLAACG